MEGGIAGEPEERYLARQSDEYVMAREMKATCLRVRLFCLFPGEITAVVYHAFRDGPAAVGRCREGQGSALRQLELGQRREAAVYGRVPGNEVRANCSILQTATDSGNVECQRDSALARQPQIAPPAVENPDAFPEPVGYRPGVRWAGGDALEVLGTHGPGMHIRVHFPSAQPIDRVDVLAGDFQWFSDMDIRIQTEKGQWLCPLSARWRIDPPVDLRREASEALKRQGNSLHSDQPGCAGRAGISQ